MKSIRQTQHGKGIIKTTILLPFVILGLALLFFIYTEINKAYWDHQVKALCEKDGGVTVYERVVLLKDTHPNLKLTSKGRVLLPFENKATLEDSFFRKVTSTNIRTHSPEVWRAKQDVIRKKDGKILSTYITYARRGGDFPTGLLHSSSFSCEKSKQDINLLNTVITIKER